MIVGQRNELIEAFAELSRRYPEWRFGQMAANVAGWLDREIWDVEDEQLLQAIRSHLEPRSCALPSPSPAMVEPVEAKL